MPKQRRTVSRPAAKKKPAARVNSRTKPVRKPARASAAPAKRRSAAKASGKKPVSKAPAKRPVARSQLKRHQPAAPAPGPSHHHAVQAFERGFRALQQRQFDRAAAALKVVISDFPDEKEMQERARVYLSICERQARGAGLKPRSFDDRLNAATVFINRGALDEGLRLLRDLEAENPGSDHVQYLLTVALTSMGDVNQALAHLRRGENPAHFGIHAAHDGSRRLPGCEQRGEQRHLHRERALLLRRLRPHRLATRWKNLTT
jgi:predicted Zn-dependent protease